MSDTEDNVPEYKPPQKASIDQLLSQDAEDESLRKYKESLLGNTVAGPTDDPRRVVLVAMKVIFENRPGGNEIVYPLETKEQIEHLKKSPFVLKEDCKYKIAITFKVQHDIVSGLKHVNSVYRKGIRVANIKTMMGSFGPQAEPHQITMPRHGWEEAPSGLLSRGSYTAKVEFNDDDGANHATVEYAFSIKSDWSKDE